MQLQPTRRVEQVPYSKQHDLLQEKFDLLLSCDVVEYLNMYGEPAALSCSHNGSRVHNWYIDAFLIYSIIIVG